jgi:hypothetical protein
LGEGQRSGGSPQQRTNQNRMVRSKHKEGRPGELPAPIVQRYLQK